MDQVPEMEEKPRTTVSEYLHGELVQADGLEAFLNAVARLASLELSGRDGLVHCGVTVLRRKKAGTVASSSTTAQALDELQYGFRDGPCLSAARTRQLVHAMDLPGDGRWPAYAAAAAAEGIHTVLAIPFDLAGQEAAALNLYAPEPGWFTTERIAAAQGYAAKANQALAISLRLAGHRDAERDALEAMKTRTHIDLAVGVIMGQNRCSQDEAFALLVSASSSRNIKLHDVAAAVLANTAPETPTTHFDR